MVRPPFVDSNGMKKGAWSEEEDNKLRAFIQRYGHWNWTLLPKYAGLSRCGKSCRLRWVNYLKPGVKRGNFSKQEEDLVIELHAQLGNKWSAIAAKLPGRTDNEIKNFWHTRVEKRRHKKNPESNKIIGHTNGASSSKGHQMLEKETHSEIETTQNESASLDGPTLSVVTNNPLVLPVTEPGPVDSWLDSFLADTAYNYQNDDIFPPLSEDNNFFYSEALHYSELSSSDSSYPSGLIDWIGGDNQSVQENLWSESFGSNISSSQSGSCYIPSQEVGGFYDPFIPYFDHGMNLFS
ncbi:hypothetical protein DH2020_031492 [Rehmannia glutinosa]|uniref:R2R3-MYB protein n=1 Tax=Rehmannia glutinosa TaxID=99300 RepID=A0ABR0VHU7_REHGL